MGFRLRRSIRILPGVRVNLGLKGGSVSIGGRGVRVTMGKRGVTETVSVPGTGLSYSHTLSGHKTNGEAPQQALPAPLPSRGPSWWLWRAALALAIGWAIWATYVHQVAELAHRGG